MKVEPRELPPDLERLKRARERGAESWQELLDRQRRETANRPSHDPMPAPVPFEDKRR